MNRKGQARHYEKIATLRCLEESLGATIRMLNHGQDRLQIARQLHALEQSLLTIKRGLIREYQALNPQPWDLLAGPQSGSVPAAGD